MRTLVRACASALVVVGLGLLAWVAYDATSVLRVFGPHVWVDEATVAMVGLAVGVFLAIAGIFIWHTAAPAEAI